MLSGVIGSEETVAMTDGEPGSGVTWPLVRRPGTQDLVAQALRSGSGALVVGDAGAGKTTLVKAMTRADPAPDGARSALWLRPPVAMVATPWAVLAPLLDDGGDGGGPEPAAGELGRLVERCRRSLGRLGEHPLVVVDDVHLIDEATAAVLAELVHLGSARIVATSRRLPAPPAALRTLVRQGVLHQVNVAGLGEDEVELVLRAVLGGPVARETVRHAWEMTDGNPWYLRELVWSLRDAGALIDVDGAWLWRDRTIVGRRFTDLIRAELSALNPAERDVVELLALAGPTALHRLARTVEDAALTTASERGLVVLESQPSDGTARARLAHLAHAEVIRTTLPPGRRRSLYERLPLGRGDPMPPVALSSTVDWALSCGVAPDVEDVVDATRAAAMIPDHRLTRRLSRAALARLEPHDPRALDLLLSRAEVARLAGERGAASEDVQAVAEHLPDGPEGEPLRWHHARITADLQQYDGDDVEAALATITRMPLADPYLRTAREADRLVRLLRAGDFRRGWPEFERFVERERDPRLRAVMLGPQILGLAQTGRLEEALRAADDALGSWQADSRQNPWLLSEVLASRTLAALWIGDLDRAMSPPPVGDPHAHVDQAVAQLGTGCCYAARGEWTTAVAHLRGALSRFAVRDPAGFGPTALANLAYCLAALGDQEGARRARAAQESNKKRGSRLLGADSAVKLLAVSVALGEAEAVGRCERLERWVSEQGLWLPALRVRHLRCVVAARRGMLSEAETAPVAEAAAWVDGPIPAILVEHVRALAAGDRLLAGRLAGRLLEYGVWVPECLDVSLTPRQREIAMLVRAGLSNREIAGRLVLSVRTVDTHVSHILARLGVSSRAGLAAALPGLVRAS